MSCRYHFMRLYENILSVFIYIYKFVFIILYLLKKSHTILVFKFPKKKLVPCQVFTGHMYMGIFDRSKSPKPHVLYSNDEGMLHQICSRAGYMSREDQASCAMKTTKRYIDGSGKRRCVGIKSSLKESAQLSYIESIPTCFFKFHWLWFNNSRSQNKLVQWIKVSTHSML